jgi:hypothetical protein
MTQPKFAGGLGFRDIELFNLALLACQAWRILTIPESLSARMLKAVYFPNGDILTAKVGTHPSQIWRSILEGRDALRIGLIRRIRDGRSTKVWTQNWLPRDEWLRPVALREEEDIPWMVSELIDHQTKTWDLLKLQKFFYPMDIEVISNVPLCHRVAVDFWAWHWEKSGVFSVRSCYRVLAATKRVREDWLDERSSSSRSANEGKLWERLWKIEVPSKV